MHVFELISGYFGCFCIAEVFMVLHDETTFSYPIGAAIDLNFAVIEMGESGFDINATYMFVPELHTPLQQPRFMDNGLVISVQYSWASPSLTGGYVLCSTVDIPLLCGGRITITVTSKESEIAIISPCLFMNVLYWSLKWENISTTESHWTTNPCPNLSVI